MTYAYSHKGRSTATVLVPKNWLALTGTVLVYSFIQYYNSTGKVVLAVGIDSVLAFYGNRMNYKRGPANVFRSCANIGGIRAYYGHRMNYKRGPANVYRSCANIGGIRAYYGLCFNCE